MRVVFIGTGDIGLPVLRDLLASPRHEVAGVVTQPDKPAGRRQELKQPPVKELAAAARVAVLQPAKIRDPRAVDEVRVLAPDVIVVMAYGQILSAGLLQIPPVACLNLHASLLPRHRGASPIQAALLAGDPESGITVMHVDEGLDTGDILLELALPIRRRETAASLHDRLAALAVPALHEAFRLLEAGNPPRTPQDLSLATYAPKVHRESGLIDWSQDCLECDRLVRAMNPWPVAFARLPAGAGAAKCLKIFRVIADRRCSGRPGEVVRADRRGILVACGQGGLVLREVQLEGRRRMPADEFLRGHPVGPGTVIA